jgi:hypothetical protein
MRHYSGRWRQFLEDIKKPGFFVKDQWQFQMHTRALNRVGEGNLHFVTDGLEADELATLSVRGHAVKPGRVGMMVQELLGQALSRGGTCAVLPEGPYCTPVAPRAAG